MQWLPGLQQEPLSPWQAAADPRLHRRHSNTQMQVSLRLCGALRPAVCKVFIEPSEHLWSRWAWFYMWFFPSYHFVGPSPLCLDVEYLSLVGSSLLLWMVVQQLASVLEFSQEKMSAHSSTLPSDHRQQTLQKSYLTYSLYFQRQVMTVQCKHQSITGFLGLVIKAPHPSCDENGSLSKWSMLRLEKWIDQEGVNITFKGPGIRETMV